MSTIPGQQPHVDAVTVQPGIQTKYYFIPIHGLQPGTNFRDVWCHLKKVVKRLEHIEIYPNSTQGWILVHKHINFIKVINTLQEPVLVQATNRASIIVPSLMNIHFKVSIQLPVQCSEHVSRIINNAAQFPYRAPSGKSVAVKPNPQAVHTEAADRRCEIVIAHGTYNPPPKQEHAGFKPKSEPNPKPEFKPKSKSKPAKPGRKSWKMRRQWSIQSNTSGGSYESQPFMPATPPPCCYEPQSFIPATPEYDYQPYYIYPYYDAEYPCMSAYYPIWTPDQAAQWYGKVQDNYVMWISNYPVQSQQSWRGWNTRENSGRGWMMRAP
ncbi:hypothetical protein RRF57_012104 [Xylaria bambusicola]|uniref:Uncharacterized protein n=1 Tax=Xylaria bambusicola TaxID=326684 RepID=A0AAN7ZAM5_9PEZI